MSAAVAMREAIRGPSMRTCMRCGIRETRFVLCDTCARDAVLRRLATFG